MEKWKKSEFQNTCVKIEHVTKRFGEALVLKEVNLTLKVGQVYGCLLYTSHQRCFQIFISFPYSCTHLFSGAFLTLRHKPRP